MSKEGFGELIHLGKAIQLLTSKAKQMSSESIPLVRARGRVVSKDIKAQTDVPHFDRSAMDGFAVRAANTFKAAQNSPVNLKLIETIHTGEIPRKKIVRGICSEIGTGGVMPDGADAVVMVENTERSENKILIYKSVAPLTNVVRRGSDIKRGTVVIAKGTTLEPQHLGALAAVGATSVPVTRKPKIILFSTGNEIVKPGGRLKKGQVYNINSVSLRAVLEQFGCEIEDAGAVRDNEKAISKKILDSVKKADVVILSGGSSLGRGDFAPEIIAKLGKLLFHGIAVKPGKPTAAGIVRGKIVIGLPGYPTSALSNVYILVQPLIEKLTGASPRPRFTTSKLAMKVASNIGRYEFLPVRLEEGLAYPSMRGSSAITSLAKADGFIEIPENVEVIEKGTPVTIRLF